MIWHWLSICPSTILSMHSLWNRSKIIYRIVTFFNPSYIGQYLWMLLKLAHFLGPCFQGWSFKFGTIESLNSMVIDQSHRYGRPQAACCEPVGSYDKTTRTAICFEHKTQYLLIRAPYTRIVVFWHISYIPPMISQSQISCHTPTFYIAAIFVKYCYTTGSWLL